MPAARRAPGRWTWPTRRPSRARWMRSRPRSAAWTSWRFAPRCRTCAGPTPHASSTSPVDGGLMARSAVRLGASRGALLRLEARRPDHRTPVLEVGLQRRGQLVGAAAGGLQAHVDQALGYGRVGDRGHGRLRQPLQRRRGRAGRREQAVPGFGDQVEALRDRPAPARGCPPPPWTARRSRRRPAPASPPPCPCRAHASA